ncbi:MAG: CPBP family intramembrane metalloprotease [Chloroflexi bacterium]|nr:CPBP family intramembrane metalloprotease [Chloroflexota bacterium]
MLWQRGHGREVGVGGGILLAGAVVLAVSALADGELGRFTGAFGNVAAIVLLAVLAQLRPVWPALRVLTWVVFGLLLTVGLALVLSASLMPVDPDGTGSLSPDVLLRLGVALGLAVLGVLGAVSLLIGGLWARLATRLGGRVDPHDTRHAQAMVGLVAASTLAFVPMIALGGDAPALLMVDADPEAFGLDRSSGGQILDMVYDLVWTIPLALLLVGVPLRRTLREALDRLGIRPLGVRGLAVGVVAAGVLWVAGTALDYATYHLWESAGWPTTDPELVDRLMGAAMSPVGAVVAAVAAGLGEELLMRGVLQPRFGWLLPNLAFTAAHAFQYNLDALVSVFVLGALLAFVRARWSTSEAIVAHGLYDLVLFLGGSIDLG